MMARLASKMKPDEEIQVHKVRVGKIPVLILKPGDKAEDGDKTAAAPALQDCYRMLLFMKKYAWELGIDEEKIMVGGESAGGGLPPAYTFVGEGEPFYAETLEYVRKLREAGIEASVDVYPTDMHARAFQTLIRT